VKNHRVVRLQLGDSAVLEVSPGHATADARTFGELRVGDQLDGRTVISVERLSYEHSFTYDILPATESGAYYAGDVLIGSTLKR
jgi:hypothetical protein